MALKTGTPLGPYEIVAPLGSGGMGDVYRAYDPRLAREVAIKVMRVGAAGREGSHARVMREARTLAGLSHPNIVDVHDVGSANDQIYIVMELLDGETLRERLGGGALPWPKAVEIGAAIADGVGAAHAKGIVHHDLKPANVFLTTDGRVKVLDFGLATLREPSSVDSLSSHTRSQTHPGPAIGTAAYMSPEQVAGKMTDARCDLFALGCILYEMSTGRRAFSRSTPVETMAAVIN